MSSPSTVARRSETSEAAIFSRVWDDESKALSPTVARYVMKLQFAAQDQARMRELAEKTKRENSPLKKPMNSTTSSR